MTYDKDKIINNWKSTYNIFQTQASESSKKIARKLIHEILEIIQDRNINTEQQFFMFYNSGGTVILEKLIQMHGPIFTIKAGPEFQTIYDLAFYNYYKTRFGKGESVKTLLINSKKFTNINIQNYIQNNKNSLLNDNKIFAETIKEAKSEKHKIIINKLKKIEDAINSVVIGREFETTLLIMSLLTQQHIFMLGPPGVAKSMHIKTLSHFITGTTLFYYQCFPTTTEEKVIGPLNVQKYIKEGINEYRLMKPGVTTSEFVFLDEIFKSTETLQYALLTILNERQFVNGENTIQVPLHTFFSASNEDIPMDNPFYDRILIKIKIGWEMPEEHELKMVKSSYKVSTEFNELKESLAEIYEYEEEGLDSLQIEYTDLLDLVRKILSLKLRDFYIKIILQIINNLRKEGVYISPRRVNWSVIFVTAAIYYNHEFDPAEYSEYDVISIIVRYLKPCLIMINDEQQETIYEAAIKDIEKQVQIEEVKYQVEEALKKLNIFIDDLEKLDIDKLTVKDFVELRDNLEEKFYNQLVVAQETIPNYSITNKYAEAYNYAASILKLK